MVTTKNSTKLLTFVVKNIPMYLIVFTLLLIALPRGCFYDGNGNNSSKVERASVQTSTLNSGQIQESSNIINIARLVLDGSKEKYDSIKDTYDKLFSVIAAISALITFLGFKGVDSFLTAKKNAEETLLRAQKALETAEKHLRLPKRL